MANNDKYIESNNEKYIEGNNEKYIATASRAMKQQETKSFVWRESAACFCWPGYDDDCDDVDGADDDDEDGDGGDYDHDEDGEVIMMMVKRVLHAFVGQIMKLMVIYPTH